jgi:peptidyl-prolyl cis-trans isomerase B (cyclophilin B)
MKRIFIWMALLTFVACARDKGQREVLIETEYGDIRIALFDDTPAHRDNFTKLIEEDFYDSLLFHRVVPDFMIQGGDPDSKKADPDRVLGMGGPGYTLKPEIRHRHFRGAVAAARLGDNVNPDKESSGSQFYIVQGRTLTEPLLRQIEQQFGITYTSEEIQRYLEEGGAPFLDNGYTVFGQVVEGMEVVDRIAQQPTGPNNRPLKDIPMNLRLD